MNTNVSTTDVSTSTNRAALNPEVKKKWVDALRSGEYKQGHGQLRGGAQQGKYCCLGVLCDVAAKEGLGAWSANAFVAIVPDNAPRDWSAVALPNAIRRWAHVNQFLPGSPVVTVKNGDGVSQPFQASLVHLNDGMCWSFEQIADIIEEQL